MNYNLRSIRTLAIVTLVFFLHLSSLQAQNSTRTIKVLESIGEVLITDNASGISLPLEEEDKFTENHTITTREDSSAILVFSNDSTVTLDENTSLLIRTFKQEAFESERIYEQLRRDPSISFIVLYLQEGTIVSRTKRLQPGSVYQVLTPSTIASLVNATAQTSYQARLEESEAEIINLSGEVLVSTNQPQPIQIGVKQGEVVTVTRNLNLSRDAIPEFSIVKQSVTETDITPSFTPDIDISIVDISPSDL